MNGNTTISLVGILSAKPVADGVYLVRVKFGYGAGVDIDALSLCEYTEKDGWLTEATYWAQTPGAEILSWMPEPVILSHYAPKAIRASYVGELYESHEGGEVKMWVDRKEGTRADVSAITMSFTKKQRKNGTRKKQ